MRGRLVTAALPAAALAACAAPFTPLDPFEPVATEAAFAERVVGRELAYPEGTIMLEAGGTVGGAFGDDVVSGDWSWQNGLVCREVWIGPRTYPETCLTPEIAEDRVRFTGGKDPLGAEAVLR